MLRWDAPGRLPVRRYQGKKPGRKKYASMSSSMTLTSARELQLRWFQDCDTRNIILKGRTLKSARLQDYGSHLCAIRTKAAFNLRKSLVFASTLT